MIFDRIMSVLWYLNFFLRKNFVDLGWIKLFKKKKNWSRWFMPVIPVLSSLRCEEHSKLEAPRHCVKNKKPSMVVHTSNFSTWRLRQEDF